MDDLVTHFVETARAMWRHRWTGLLAAWLVGLVGVAVLARIPDRYEASARVYVDTKSVLRPLMRDLTVEPDLSQTLGLLTQTLITRPNIERLIDMSRLSEGSRGPGEREQLIEKLTREIRISGGGRESVFTFSFRAVDPREARTVVQNLVSMFVESDVGAKRRDAEAARAFIDDQIKSYEARLAEAEGRLKDFKLRNMNVADASGKDYFARIAALNEESGKLNLELKSAEQARDALRRQLDGESAQLIPEVPDAPAAPPPNPEIDTRLDAQRRLLDDLLRRYTDLHPDVISARRLIAALEEQKRNELEAWRKAQDAKPVVKRAASVDTSVQRLRFALAEAEAAVASLKVRAGDTQARLNQMKAAANKVPQIEAEFAQLNRDYDVVRRNYDALVARREKASISEDVDSTRVEQFRVIDPPRTAQKPVFPNRLGVAPFVVLIALAMGVAITFGMAQLFPSISSSKQLRALTQRPTLGSISVHKTIDMLRAQRRRNWAFGSALTTLITAFGAWIGWLYSATLI